MTHRHPITNDCMCRHGQHVSKQPGTVVRGPYRDGSRWHVCVRCWGYLKKLTRRELKETA